MNENINICPECGTENEAQYQYCKNCGTSLQSEIKKEPEEQQPPVVTAPPEHNEQNTYSTEYACIDGIPLEDVQVFIGKKSNEICPKFINMEITHSKNSWIWPPAILGFFFGPLGAALWFFYRKMYKHAFILAAIGAVIDLIKAVLTFNVTDTFTDAFINAFASGNFSDAISAIEGSLKDVNTISNTVATLIENLSTIATSVIVGIFGCYWYKNHCISKIKEFRTMNPDNNYYRLGLMSLGGTSGGMLALGIMLALGVDYVISFLTTILSAFF